MSNRGKCLFFTLVLFPMSIAFGEAPSPQPLPMVTIDRELTFLTSEGADLVIVPGVYSVAALASGLQLIHHKASFPFSVSAAPTTHQENVARPVALLIASDPELLHIVLLLPGGKALDAIGYLNPARPRDVIPKVLESSRITAAVMKQGAGQAAPPTVAPAVPPSVVPAVPPAVPPSVAPAVPPSTSSSVPSSPGVTTELQRLAAEQAQAKAELEPAALLARIKVLEWILSCMDIEGYGKQYAPAFPPTKVYPAQPADVRWNGKKCPGK